ncbi:hypothetical protein POM88_054909 [Heracleum sosnowskyi]|uniref:Transposase-associated domain-containing protein n=1 Tax=Heracleum sosnowskyi TaxID=360622 RepID=A0AAD8LUF6_9APIA|nr:hypothetical protein POM88_054909 [Heracleum sosnowskyi]
MDRHTWMYEISRATEEYVDFVNNFITCAIKDLEKKYGEHGKKDIILCPCHDCNNLKKYRSVETVQDHLIRRGFKQNYTRWIWHGEGLHSDGTSDRKYVSGEIVWPMTMQKMKMMWTLIE